MTRVATNRLLKGVGMCVLLLVLLYMYVLLKEKPTQGPQVYGQESLGQGQSGPMLPKDTLKYAPKDSSKDNPAAIPLSPFLNLVTIPPLSSSNQSTAAQNDGCVRTKTNPAFHICTYPPQKDLYVSGALRNSGVWEPALTRTFQMALRKFPGVTVIDAGANIGYYCFMSALMGHPVIAVEPTKANLDKLVRGVQLNGAEGKMKVLFNAVAERHKKVGMAENVNNQGAVNVKENFTAGQGVQTILMDDLIPLVHTHDVIVMIDIEGYECHAMAASDELIKRFNVVYIFMEWSYMYVYRKSKTATCPAPRMQELSDHLIGLGYVPHDARTLGVIGSRNSVEWTAGNILWRRKDQPMFTA